MILLILIYILIYSLYLIQGGLVSFLIGNSILILTIILVFIKNKIMAKNAYKKLKLDYDYLRKLPNNLDINDILFLNNTSFYSKKSIRLMVMQLQLKGLIKITKENNQIIIKNTYIDCETSYAEDYILNYISSDNKKDFSCKEYNYTVKKDLIKKNIAYDKNDLSYFKFYFFLSSIIFLVFTYFYVHKTINTQLDLDVSIVMGFILLVFPSVPLYYLDELTHTLNLKLSTEGWYYKYAIKSYKRFLKDFTRINKLKNENYPLWEKHLLYAQALNINMDYYNIPDIKLSILNDKDIDTLFN